MLYESDTGQTLQLISDVGLLPGQARSAEMAVGCGGSVDGTAQVEAANDAAGGHVHGGAEQLGHLLVGNDAGAVGIHTDGNGLSYADGIGQLHLNLLGKACSNQVLGHVAGHVGSGTVHLGGILAGEGAAAVGEVAAVGIYNDLTAGQTGVAVGAADDEIAGGVDVDVGNICRSHTVPARER